MQVSSMGSIGRDCQCPLFCRNDETPWGCGGGATATLERAVLNNPVADLQCHVSFLVIDQTSISSECSKCGTMEGRVERESTK